MLFTVVSDLLGVVEGSQVSVLMSLVSQRLPVLYVKRCSASEVVGVCAEACTLLPQSSYLKGLFFRKSSEPVIVG